VFDFDSDADGDQHHQRKPGRRRASHPRLAQASQQTNRRARLRFVDQRALGSEAVAFELPLNISGRNARRAVSEE
jgi:hypothetical protein